MYVVFCKFSTRFLLLLALLLSSSHSIFANLIYVANFESQSVSVAVTSYTLVSFDNNGKQSLPISLKVAPIKG